MENGIARKILMVDDEDNVLRAYCRNLNRDFSIEVALGGPQAIQALESHGPFAVVVADMRMPGMDGLELLKTIKERWPDVIRVMLTGNADQATAMNAVNQGEVFRFLTKPCPTEQIRLVLLAALRQHYLQESEKLLLERTLVGTLRVLTDLIGFANPEASRLAQITRERVRVLGEAMRLESTWDLEAAAMLAPIGLAMLPAAVSAKLRANKPLSPSESAMVARIPDFGARLVENIPRMGRVSTIIRDQSRGPETRGESAIFWLVSEFSRREEIRKDRRVVLEEMRLSLGKRHEAHLAIMEQLFVANALPDSPEKTLPIAAVREGMVLARNILDPAGQPILLKGLRLDRAHLDMVAALVALHHIEEPIHVFEC